MGVRKPEVYKSFRFNFGVGLQDGSAVYVILPVVAFDWLICHHPVAVSEVTTGLLQTST